MVAAQLSLNGSKTHNVACWCQLIASNGCNSIFVRVSRAGWVLFSFLYRLRSKARPAGMLRLAARRAFPRIQQPMRTLGLAHRMGCEFPLMPIHLRPFSPLQISSRLLLMFLASNDRTRQVQHRNSCALSNDCRFRSCLTRLTSVQ